MLDTQSKGATYIHPPTPRTYQPQAIHAQVQRKKYIVIDKATIETQGQESHIYNPNGTYMATIYTKNYFGYGMNSPTITFHK